MNFNAQIPTPFGDLNDIGHGFMEGMRSGVDLLKRARGDTPDQIVQGGDTTNMTAYGIYALLAAVSVIMVVKK